MYLFLTFYVSFITYPRLLRLGNDSATLDCVLFPTLLAHGGRKTFGSGTMKRRLENLLKPVLSRDKLAEARSLCSNNVFGESDDELDELSLDVKTPFGGLIAGCEVPLEKGGVYTFDHVNLPALFHRRRPPHEQMQIGLWLAHGSLSKFSSFRG